MPGCGFGVGLSPWASCRHNQGTSRFNARSRMVLAVGAGESSVTVGMARPDRAESSGRRVRGGGSRPKGPFSVGRARMWSAGDTVVQMAGLVGVAAGMEEEEEWAGAVPRGW